MNILCLDGGGMKGAVSCSLLQKLEEKTGKQCYQMFDLICGTSIGGILSLLLSSGISAEEALNFFYINGPVIFKQNFFTKLKLLNTSKYNSNNLEMALKEKFGDLKLKDSKTRIFVTSYDNNGSGKPFFFKSYDETSEYFCWQAGRATSAAPIYFSPFQLDNMILGDGGLVANDATMCAFADSKILFPGQEVKILSIGTGKSDSDFDGKTLINAGLLKAGLQAISALYDGPNDEIKYQAKVLLGNNYYRIDPNLIENIEMDDASPSGLEKLKASSAAAIVEFSPLIDKFISDCV